MSNNIDINPNKKKSLGRGLGSLFGDSLSEIKQEPQVSEKIETAKSTIPDHQRIWSVAIEKILPNAGQPRKDFDPQALKELSDSIREKGILQPITVRKTSNNQFEIIAGERRWRAAQKAGLREVPVIVRTSDDQDAFELAIIENIQRADLNALEEAEAYDQLMRKYALTQQEISQKVGKERATVANALRLLSLPPPVKQMLKQNQISSGHAKVILSLDDSDQQISIAKVVVAEKLSVRATEKLVAQSKFRGAESMQSNQTTNQMAKIDISKN